MDPAGDPGDCAEAVIDFIRMRSPALLGGALDGLTQAVAILATMVMQHTIPRDTRNVCGVALSRILRDNHAFWLSRSDEERAMLQSAADLLLQYNETQWGHHRIVSGR